MDVRDAGTSQSNGLARNVYAFSGTGTIIRIANLVHE